MPEARLQRTRDAYKDQLIKELKEKEQKKK